MRSAILWSKNNLALHNSGPFSVMTLQRKHTLSRDMYFLLLKYLSNHIHFKINPFFCLAPKRPIGRQHAPKHVITITATNTAYRASRSACPQLQAIAFMAAFTTPERFLVNNVTNNNEVKGFESKLLVFKETMMTS